MSDIEIIKGANWGSGIFQKVLATISVKDAKIKVAIIQDRMSLAFFLLLGAEAFLPHNQIIPAETMQKII
ncbi:hypothetical protein DCF50_p2511 [Dehalobacter sp. CF]|nr:hypothetical protein DCF50_p2511 [Dehalobacter sp. CF]